MEGRLLVLWWRRGAEHLRGGRLVEADLSFAVVHVITERIEQAQRAERVDVGRVLRLIEGDAHMRLGAEVVDLVGLDLLDGRAQGHPVG